MIDAFEFEFKLLIHIWREHAQVRLDLLVHLVV